MIMSELLFVVAKGASDCITTCKPDAISSGINGAERYCTENIRLLRRNLELYSENFPEGYWQRQIDEQQARLDAGFEAITIEEIIARKRAKYITGELTEITAERYDEMLGVLPPLHWVTIDDVSEFCISEMWELSFTNQYAYDKLTGKYYTAMVDANDKSTWINNLLRK